MVPFEKAVRRPSFWRTSLCQPCRDTLQHGDQGLPSCSAPWWGSHPAQHMHTSLWPTQPARGGLAAWPEAWILRGLDFYVTGQHGMSNYINGSFMMIRSVVTEIFMWQADRCKTTKLAFMPPILSEGKKINTEMMGHFEENLWSKLPNTW